MARIKNSSSFRLWALGGVAALLLPIAQAHATDQSSLDQFAAAVGYRFTVLDNLSGAACSGGGTCFTSRLDITMPAQPLQGSWKMFVSFVFPIASIESDLFDLTPINGDLFQIATKPGAVFQSGQTYGIKINAPGHDYTVSFSKPNAFIVVDGLRARTIAASQPTTNPDTGFEQLPFVTPLTDEARQARSSTDDATRWLTPQMAYLQNARSTVAQPAPQFAILPTPRQEAHLPGRTLDVGHGVTLKLNNVQPGDVAAAVDYLKALGVHDADRGPTLQVAVDAGVGPAGSYTIRTVADDSQGGGRIEVRAADAAGASYAIRSLAQQVGADQGDLRPLAIGDGPRFTIRGMHIDLARNFHSKAEVLKLIEEMATYKLNRLHLHLGDDEGWRLEVPELPELTAVGAYRCYDPTETRCLLPQLGAGPDGTSPVNGYLSQQDYTEILQFAAARQIEVMPSFDMPGHSRAAVRSMEARYQRLTALGQTAAAAEYRLVEPEDKTVYRSIQNYYDNTLNVCLPATYHFIDTVISSVAALHRAAGVPLKHYHIGGDETAGAWTASPACAAFTAQNSITTAQLGAYFITKVAKDLAGRGIGPAAWSDGVNQIAASDVPGGLQSNSWGTLGTGGVADAQAQINRGLDVVMSTPDLFYYDFAYVTDPQEPGADWASRGIDLLKIFGFMPDNLPANAILVKDIQSHPITIADTTPLAAGKAVRGIQGQLWSETVRNDAQADYMIYPRLIALSERAWHVGAWEVPYKAGQAYCFGDKALDARAFIKDWQGFKDRIGLQFPWLDDAGVKYRIPTVGARWHDGMLQANLPYGDFAIDYQAANGPWTEYRGPVASGGVVSLRARAPNGRVGRSVTLGSEPTTREAAIACAAPQP